MTPVALLLIQYDHQSQAHAVMMPFLNLDAKQTLLYVVLAWHFGIAMKQATKRAFEILLSSC